MACLQRPKSARYSASNAKFRAARLAAVHTAGLIRHLLEEQTRPIGLTSHTSAGPISYDGSVPGRFVPNEN